MKGPHLVLVSVYSSRFTLFGRSIVGERESEIRSWLASHGIMNPKEVPLEDDSNTPIVSKSSLLFEGNNLSISVVDSLVRCVQWIISHTGLAQACLNEV